MSDPDWVAPQELADGVVVRPDVDAGKKLDEALDHDTVMRRGHEARKRARDAARAGWRGNDVDNEGET